ncbi:hypothetical protein [Streptomyces ardesiacus]
MSALDTIKAYILAHYADDDPAYVTRIRPQLDAEAQEIYDAVAQELAEKIRKAVDDKSCCVSEVDGMWEAANLIDPEVRHG